MTPAMPPSLQFLPNELKQQIAANLIIPDGHLDSSLTLFYPPRYNELIDASSILALRLVSRDMRDNSATAFETIISEICIGPHESSMDRFVKMSEDRYFQQHIQHITFSPSMHYAEHTYEELLLLHDSGFKDSVSENLAELFRSFCNNEQRMLYSGAYTVNIVRALKNLNRCESIAISGGQWSSESTKLKRSLSTVLDGSWFIFSNGAGKDQLLSAVCHAITNSRIRLRKFNVCCDRMPSAALEGFDEEALDTATFGSQFSQLSTLMIKIDAFGSRKIFGTHLNEFVNAIPSVQDLTLLFSTDGIYANPTEQHIFSNIFMNNLALDFSLPNLEKLSLLHLGSKPAHVSRLISKHRATLRILHLIDIGFRTPEEWTWFLGSLVRKQNLEQMSIILAWHLTADKNKQMLPELESLWVSARSSSSDVGFNGSLRRVADEWETILCDR